MRAVIGLCGESLAGKETVGNFVAEWAGKNGFTSSTHSTTGLLGETLRQLQTLRQNGWTANGGLGICILQEILSIWNIKNTDTNLFRLAKAIFSDEGFGDGNVETTTPNKQKLLVVMTNQTTFGKGALTRAVKARILLSKTDVAQFDSVRMPEDEEMMSEFVGYANQEHPDIIGITLYITADEKVRYERALLRKRDAREASLTGREFRDQGQTATEIHIADIGSRADRKIVNNYDTLEPLREDVYKFCEMFIRTIIAPNDSYV